MDRFECILSTGDTEFHSNSEEVKYDMVELYVKCRAAYRFNEAVGILNSDPKTESVPILHLGESAALENKGRLCFLVSIADQNISVKQFFARRGTVLSVLVRQFQARTSYVVTLKSGVGIILSRQ